MPDQPAQPKKPLGKALNQSDADLDRRAQITVDDLEETAAEAPPEVRALLEAEPEEGPAGR